MDGELLRLAQPQPVPASGSRRRGQASSLPSQITPLRLHPLCLPLRSPRQVRKTFEDLYAEVLRMNRGAPSLAPYAQVRRSAWLGLSWHASAHACALRA